MISVSADEQSVFPAELLGRGPTEVHRLEHGRPRRNVGHLYKEFSFEGFGERFHMQLEPKHDLLAPGFRVYHLKRGFGHESSQKAEDFENCLFNGKLKHQRRSAVALNLCGGMVSSLHHNTLSNMALLSNFT